MNFLRSLSLLIVAVLPATAELTVRVKPTRGGPQIHVNGKPVSPRFFYGVARSGTRILDEDGENIGIGGPPGPFLQQVALARDAGVNLVSFSAPNCWTPPEIPLDWRSLDALCRQIIKVNSKALLVPRVSAYAPDWWLQQHPEALMIYDTNQPGKFASVSHQGYRAAAAAHLEELCRHLTKTFPNHFAGVHPCGQNTGEWFYEGSWERPLSGYDPATRVAFRAWLKAGGAADFAIAEPPSADERRTHPNGVLHDPPCERRLIEFARFQQREMADMVLALAEGARRGSDGKKLVVFFYGYQFEFPPLANGAPTSGHYALAPVLHSKDIDILCSPISYFDREWLGTAPCMSPAESVRNAGVLWLNEDDSRTHLDTRMTEHVQEGGLVNLRQTRQVMLRNTAQAALRGFGTWWMDLSGEGWFNDAAIWEEQKKLKPVERAMVKRAGPFAPEIAAILGEDSLCHLTAGSSVVAKPLIYEGRAALGRCGAPYGQFTLADALAGKVSAKLQLFLAAWSLTPDERRSLATHRPPNTTRVWCYAPGYLLPDRGDVTAMNEVTGFKHRALSPGLAEATPTEAGRKLGLTKPWGPKEAIKPLFTVEANPAETLATYQDGSPAVALRRSPRGLDIFVGVPALTPELVRALARMSGVHLFTEEDAAVWATEGFLSIQAHKTGPLLIQTGRPRNVVDALSGAKLGRGPSLKLPMEAGEVRVLRY